MAWTPDPFPAALLVWCGLLLCLSFAVLSRTLARRSRLALLLSVSFGAVSLWGLVSSFWTPDSWSAQTLIERLIELPIVATFAILCAIQARRTPASKSRLKQTLRMGAPLIFGAWILALVGEQIWPQPILNPFARMPVRNFTLLATLCIPIMAYQWILVYAFIRAARSKVATMRLRLQNLFVAVGLAGYALSGINVVVGYGFQAFVANPLLREITLIQFAIEDRLLVVWASAFLIALVLAGGGGGEQGGAVDRRPRLPPESPGAIRGRVVADGGIGRRGKPGHATLRGLSGCGQPRLVRHGSRKSHASRQARRAVEGHLRRKFIVA